MDFEHWVRTFADGSSGHDAPGASPFIFAYARAMVYMGQIGYAESDLTCMQCTSSVCTDPSCRTANVQCGLNNKFGGHPPPSSSPTRSPVSLPPTTIVASTTAALTPPPNSQTSTAPASNSPTPSSGAGSLECGPCSADDEANVCSRCAPGGATVCTAGAAMGGCGGEDTWTQGGACTTCCLCSAPPQSSSLPVTSTVASTTPSPTSLPATTTLSDLFTTTNAPSFSGAPNFTCAPCGWDVNETDVNVTAALCARCPSSDPFVCTAGLAVGGCGGADTWGTSPLACTACCECPPQNLTTTAPLPTLTCGPCSADEVSALCHNCSSGDRFTCTAGPAVGGCAGASVWNQQACSACCVCPTDDIGSTAATAVGVSDDRVMQALRVPALATPSLSRDPWDATVGSGASDRTLMMIFVTALAWAIAA